MPILKLHYVNYFSCFKDTHPFVKNKKNYLLSLLQIIHVYCRNFENHRNVRTDLKVTPNNLCLLEFKLLSEGTSSGLLLPLLPPLFFSSLSDLFYCLLSFLKCIQNSLLWTSLWMVMEGCSSKYSLNISSTFNLCWHREPNIHTFFTFIYF